MTQEEKQLLIKDLCARLPYGINVLVSSLHTTDSVRKKLNANLLFGLQKSVLTIKPYLRPMSSMTEEEKKYISDKCGFSISGSIRNECGLVMPVLAADWLIDFYNEHHIDYHGLIPMGLALEASADMYKNK